MQAILNSQFRESIKDLANGYNDTSIQLTPIQSISYIAIAGCVLEHITFSKELCLNEKLYYILADSLCLINASTGKERSVALSAKAWALKLNCSRSQIFVMQQNLERLGYFVIAKDKNKEGQNKRNILTCTLPDSAFNKLERSPNKKGDHLPYQESSESRRSYLDRTKLFIALNYSMLKSLCTDKSLSLLHKLLWLDLYAISYKSSSYQEKKGSGSLSGSLGCIISYGDLAKKHRLSPSSLSRAMSKLEQDNLISKSRIFSRKEPLLGERSDKSLWKIEIKVPNSILRIKTGAIDHNIVSNKVIGDIAIKPEIEAIDKLNDKPNVSDESIETVEVDSHTNSQIARADPHYAKISQYNNKDSILKKDRSSTEKDRSNNLKNNFEEKKEKIMKEEKGGKKQEQNHQEIANTQKNTVINLKRRKLEEFYPITEDDAYILQKLSGRDFSIGYINKLILKLGKERPENGFYKKDLFISYMTQALIKEMRDAEQASKIDFRFKVTDTLEQEQENQTKYLEKIEYSQDTSKQAQLRRKIAARFDNEVAYKLLTLCHFMGLSNSNNEFTIKLKNKNIVTELEQELLLDQIRAVYGQHIEKLEFTEEKKISYLRLAQSGSNNATSAVNDKKGQSLTNHEYDGSNDNSNDTIINSVVDDLKQYLYQILGENVYHAWFSKVRIKVSEMNNIDRNNNDNCKSNVQVYSHSISIEAPTSFKTEWIKSNYLTYIQQYCRGKNYNLLGVYHL